MSKILSVAFDVIFTTLKIFVTSIIGAIKLMIKLVKDSRKI